jgi:hypothetical protein
MRIPPAACLCVSDSSPALLMQKRPLRRAAGSKLARNERAVFAKMPPQQRACASKCVRLAQKRKFSQIFANLIIFEVSTGVKPALFGHFKNAFCARRTCQLAPT